MVGELLGCGLEFWPVTIRDSVQGHEVLQQISELRRPAFIPMLFSARRATPSDDWIPKLAVWRVRVPMELGYGIS